MTTAPPPRAHRVLVPSLLAIATVIGFWACLAVWVNRQALDTTTWTNTSSRVLEDPRVQSALGAYLVDELFSAVDVPAKLQEALPGELQGLSGPLSAGLRAVAGRVVPQLLAQPRVQQLWRSANRTAHRELLSILSGGTKVLATRSGVVVLDLHELITDLGAQLGLSNQLATARSKLAGGSGKAAQTTVQQKLGLSLPSSDGRIVIMRSGELRGAQSIVEAIRGLALLLPLLSLGLFAAAITLAEGWRRFVLRSTGLCFFGIGLAVLFARHLGGDEVISSLVPDEVNRPAAEAVWSIGTSLLYDTAIAMLLYGLVLVAAAWLVGPAHPARSLRRAAAPWLRLHPVGSYAMTGLLFLLIVYWGPTPATRRLLPVLGFAALGAVGVAFLRRRTAAEFPDALPGETLAHLRGLWRSARHPAGEFSASVTGSPADGEPPLAAGTPETEANAGEQTVTAAPAGPAEGSPAS